MLLTNKPEKYTVGARLDPSPMFYWEEKEC